MIKKRKDGRRGGGSKYEVGSIYIEAESEGNGESRQADS